MVLLFLLIRADSGPLLLFIMAGCISLLSFQHGRQWSSFSFSSWQKVDLASFTSWQVVLFSFLFIMAGNGPLFFSYHGRKRARLLLIMHGVLLFFLFIMAGSGPLLPSRRGSFLLPKPESIFIFSHIIIMRGAVGPLEQYDKCMSCPTLSISSYYIQYLEYAANTILLTVACVSFFL